MLSTEEIDTICSEEIKIVIDENINNDFIRIALDKRIPHAKLVASQVKYLQRAKNKLPSYYNARCIIPSLSFEQSSSEECAMSKNYNGDVCIDLTCGLGVDSFFLSKQFNRVISIERDPTLAYLASVNFNKLNVKNIDVVNCSAEEFIAKNSKMRVDMIYVDPDRRGDSGEKLFLLQHCSPNVIEIMGELKNISKKIAIKCSPLLDVDEIFNIFNFANIEVISLNGECKEVMIELNSEIEEQNISAVAIGQGQFTVKKNRDKVSSDYTDFKADYKYLITPDVSLQKARLVKDFYIPQGVYVASENGYGFSDSIPESVMGRIIEIEEIIPYTSKSVKRILKDRKIKNIDILKRDFNLSSDKIAKELNIKQGGKQRIAFTTINHKLWAIILK